MLHSKNCKHCGKKRWISRETDAGRRNLLRPAEAVDSVLEPVFSDVSVNEGIGGHCRETKNEQKAQGNCGNCRPEKETQMVAHQLAHVTNIPAA